MIKHNVSLYNKQFKYKPTNEEIKEISGNIARFPRTLSVKQLAREVKFRKPYCLTQFSPQLRKNENWQGQSIFALDFDSGIAFDAILRRCNEYRFYPCFAYNTYTSTEEKPRFRIWFQTKEPISSLDTFNQITKSLLRLFPEADRSCTDPARLWFAGIWTLHENYNAYITIKELIECAEVFIKLSDPSNAKRNIKRYRQDIGFSPSIYGNGRVGDVSPSITKRANVDSSNSQKSKDKITPNWDRLSSSCQLFKEFMTGKHWAWHNELYGLMLNLIHLVGGETKFKEGLASRPEYSSDKHGNKQPQFTHRWIPYAKEHAYQPNACQNFCPFHATCKNDTNIVTRAALSKHAIIRLNAPIEIPLAIAEQHLREAIQAAISEPGISIVKASTGLGKTEQYLNMQEVTIAVPTHSLKKEVVGRLRVPCTAVPELPDLPPTDKKRLESLYQTGRSQEAYHELVSMAQDNPIVADYLQDLQAYSSFSGTKVTTHERAIATEGSNKLLIFDEDPLPSLLRQDSCHIHDLELLANNCTNANDKVQLLDLCRFVEASPGYTVFPIPPIHIEDNKALSQIIEANHISSNVLSFLHADYWAKTEPTKIAYISKRTFPADKKIIILSATVNKFMWESLYPDQVHFHDIGQVENQGMLVQYTEQSFSRTFFDENPEHINSLSAFLGPTSVITFKKHANKFQNCIATFGNLAGLDKFSGKDLAIVGTPHINPAVYLLYAKALGLPTEGIATNLSRREIVYNGLQFKFQTYATNSALQKLQCALIETELLQAIGRARLIRNSCTVTVFSNFPVQGATYKLQKGA